jgi:hypothetical protein
MKIQELIYDMLVEEFGNKKLLNLMLTKWYGQELTDEQRNEGEFLIAKFFELKNRLSTNLPEVITFLNKFDEFDGNKLKEVTSYTLPQIKFIVGEFFDIEGGVKPQDDIPEVLRGRNLPPTPERIEASKGLWFVQNDNLIVNDEGFRVYVIKNRKDSINYGYYQGYLSQQEPYASQRSHMQWCTTRHVETSNLYGGYRNRRTFYFIIDESKNPQIQPDVNISQYYLSALQYATDSPTNYKVTSMLNDGSDPVFTEEQLYQIYPKLRGNLDKIIPIQYDESELGAITDDLDRVDERETNTFEFAKVSKQLKKKYIDAGKTLTKMRSWETMDDGLKQSYIDLTTRVNLFERFSTKELLLKIKSRSSDVKSLDRRVKIVGYEDGFGILYSKMMETEFIPDQRKSLKNGDISLFENRRTKKFGLFNKSKGEWVTLGGISYEDFYNKVDDDIFISDDGDTFTVEVYSKSNVPDQSSFYIVIPIDDNINGYFVSSKKWLELQEKLQREDGETNFDRENDSDISERKKGR